MTPFFPLFLYQLQYLDILHISVGTCSVCRETVERQSLRQVAAEPLRASGERGHKRGSGYSEEVASEDRIGWGPIYVYMYRLFSQKSQSHFGNVGTTQYSVQCTVIRTLLSMYTTLYNTPLKSKIVGSNNITSDRIFSVKRHVYLYEYAHLL